MGSILRKTYLGLKQKPSQSGYSGRRKLKMKATIISETNKARIEKEIESAQEKARTRKINFQDILYAIKRIDVKLNITKKAKEGVRVSVALHADKYPNAYRGIPESTHFLLVFKGGKWRLADIYRFSCNRKNTYHTKLSETAKEAIIENCLKF